MIITIFGGASSGKSDLAEDVAVKAGGRKAYFATAQVYDDEMAKRVERHKEKRANKGFETVEKSKNINASDMELYDTVLIECMSNWVANEMFTKNGGRIEYIFEFMNNIRGSARTVIIVTNDIFGDGAENSESVNNYMKNLAKVNICLGDVSNIFLEIVCGEVICLKGKEIYAKYI